MTGRTEGDPLDVGGKPPYRIAGHPPGIISDDDYDVTDEALAFLALAPALVAVARAARERRHSQIDSTHYHIYDPACPCCQAQDREWAALARLEEGK